MFYRKIIHLAAMAGVAFLSVAVFVTAGIETTEAASVTVDIPDNNLEAVIRESINKPSGSISNLDVEKLISLDGSHRSITNLTGLEYCVNLTQLDLSFNQISNISVISGLNKLTELRLSNNPVSDITHLSGLGNLEGLWLANIKTSEISPLSSLTSLTSLILSYNHISDISPISALTNLISLDLSVNQISDISPLSGLSNITELWIGYNRISDISPLSELSKLVKLRISDNQISDISTLSILTKLTNLTLSNNLISELSPLSSLIELTSLRLESNQISDISPVLNLINLTYLNLRDNTISDISLISSLSNLRYLNLEANRIIDITPISSLTYLSVLKLDNNQIPYADFTAATISGGNAITVSFNNTSLSFEGIASCLWDFGDEQISTDYNPTHKYSKEGIYTVSLTITEPDGDSYTVKKSDYYTLEKILAFQSVSPSNSTIVKSEDEKIVIEFPENSVAVDALVGIREGSQVDRSDCPSGFQFGATCFYIDISGDLVPGTVVNVIVEYRDADMEACDGDSCQLTLSHYDEDTGQWKALPTTIDTAAMTLTASTTEFSRFTVMAETCTAELQTSAASDVVSDKGTPLWILLVSVAGGLLFITSMIYVLIMASRKKTNKQLVP